MPDNREIVLEALLLHDKGEYRIKLLNNTINIHILRDWRELYQSVFTAR